MKVSPPSVPPSASGRVRLVVVDDQGSVRGLFREAIARRTDYELVGEGRTGMDALRLCRQLAPEVLIMELMLREMNAATVIEELRAEGLRTRALIFTGCRNEAALLDALRTRPHGFVHKDESLPALWAALSLVARGGCSVSPSLGRLNEIARTGLPGAGLTNRERIVLQMIAEGQPNKSIAQNLGVSPKTIEHNRASLMEKLGVHDIARLTRIAVQMGLVG